MGKIILDEMEIVKLFYVLLELAEPYTAINGNTYVEVKAEDCYYVNVWCRKIPNVTRTLKVNTVCIKIS